jgi:hypothetical protein
MISAGNWSLCARAVGRERVKATSCRRDNNGLLCGVVPDRRIKTGEHGESGGASLFECSSAIVCDAVALDFDRSATHP